MVDRVAFCFNIPYFQSEELLLQVAGSRRVGFRAHFPLLEEGRGERKGERCLFDRFVRLFVLITRSDRSGLLSRKYIPLLHPSKGIQAIYKKERKSCSCLAAPL
jgi:hypothetical protein